MILALLPARILRTGNRFCSEEEQACISSPGIVWGGMEFGFQLYKGMIFKYNLGLWIETYFYCAFCAF